MKLYENYKMWFENNPFNSETTETGIIISDEIAEAQQKKWKTLIESQQQKSVENYQQTVKVLRATSTAM